MQALGSGYGSAVPVTPEPQPQSKLAADGRPAWMQQLEGLSPAPTAAAEAESSDDESAEEVSGLTLQHYLRAAQPP